MATRIKTEETGTTENIEMAEQGEQQQIQVNVSNKSLRTLEFVPEAQQSNEKRWSEWLEGLEREFRYFRIDDTNDKKDALIIYGGKEVARLAKTLPDPTVKPDYALQTEQLDAYTRVKWKITDFYTVKKNKHHSRFLFNNMKQEHGEGVVSYATRLRERATECEFENLEDRILEHLILTVNDKSLIQRAISKEWNLATFMSEAGQMEDLRIQVDTMTGDANRTIASVREKTRYKGKQNHDATHQKKRPNEKKHQGESSKLKACTYCGLIGKHPPGRNCPAYGKKCGHCNKYNHFAKVCQKHNHEEKTSPRKNIKKTQEVDNDTSTDEEYFNAVKQIRSVKTKDVLITVRMEDVDVRIEPDSGADANVLDEHQFRALQKLSKKKIQLQPSKVILNTLQAELPVKGEANVTVRNKTRGVETKVIVIKGRIGSPPLLGRETLMKLGMMKIDPTGALEQENELKIKAIHQEEHYEKMKEKYKEVFEGIGLIEDKKNGREFYAKLHMKENAIPVAQKARNVAYYLQEPLRELLEECVKQDIYEKIPESEPVTWCSPLVVQPKPRYKNEEKLKPQMIRASIDLRVPNSYMERNRITQSPIVEDFTHKFHDCKIFSKLDMNQGYHQLLLCPESRSIATFSTPWGNMRPKRLIFGAKASQDSFDEAMQRIFGDIPYCLNQRDDILIGGRDRKHHDETLEKVLQRAKDFGITFSKDKCQFGVKNIEFYGYKFTEDGLKPTTDKVRAIKECGTPTSKTAVRSFLGMTGYLSKFIPNYSVLTAPLRRLTEKDTRFRWTEKEQHAFEALKESITDEKTMAYFDPKLPIILRTEASYHEGLSAALFQKRTDGIRPVHFISRSMTETEKRYSQTEKDALAIAWAKKRLHLYLIGAPKIKIITAHKPLVTMFNKPTAKLPPRIEKWVMSMQDVDFEVNYEPGKDEKDPLDYISRFPLPETDDDDDTESYIKRVIHQEHAPILEKMKNATQNDDVSQKIIEAITNNHWENLKNKPEYTPYYGIKEELYVSDGIIFRMNKIIVPQRLQQSVIHTAHSMGHLGMTKMKAMVRARYWFPEMDRMIENTVKKCYECQITTKHHREEPVKMTKIPEQPWESVSADFGGPYPDGHYNLVVVDKRTRYPEVEQQYTTAAKPTIQKMREIMARNGIPRRLETDGGPPFNSTEFKEFSKEMGFEHHIVTPEHARANGEAESFMKMLNKTEQIAKLQGENSKTAITNMLMGYRSTPHPATQTTPFKALMNREVRTKLDTAKTDNNSEMNEEITENDKRYKAVIGNYANNKQTVKEHTFVEGDYVLLKQQKQNKLSTAYEPAFYIIYKIEGSTIHARRIHDGRDIQRDSSKFKNVNMVVRKMMDEKEEEENNWREKLLQNYEGERQDCRERKDGGNEESGITQTELIGVIEPTKEKTPFRTNERPVRKRQMPEKFKDYVLCIIRE